VINLGYFKSGWIRPGGVLLSYDIMGEVGLD
jgi:hypothetical protein